MAVSATAVNTGISAQKAKPIADLVRGKMVDEALVILRFLPSPVADQVSRVIKSASANAENEMLARASNLRIIAIYANEGPRTKRFRARARGRAGRINRRNSHVTVVVEEQEL